MGAALFGVGWGVAGMCPGANLAALGTGDPRGALFALSWISGLLLTRSTLEWVGAASDPKRVSSGGSSAVASTGADSWSGDSTGVYTTASTLGRDNSLARGTRGSAARR